MARFGLGRRFTTAEAVKRFLSALQSATRERELVERAEGAISEIFRAPGRIELGPGGLQPSFETALEVPIRSGGSAAGVVRLGPRADRVPFFSEDAALLGALAEVFVPLLENVRLQEKRREQETRARELSLHASRSELKALRAQIQPHFLFNALNAIAGLIRRDPGRADRTVEHLAEVFRYTLRRSEAEWAVLEEEMEFVHAYLEVEQARFGPRLEFSLEVAEDVRAAPIPTMIVQTLVENAVKHGVAQLRGAGRVEVRAGREGERLVVEVADNGPGFREPVEAAAAREPGENGGFGLRSVRERLRGYFGEEAALSVRRDEASGRTVVSISLPIAGAAAAARASGTGGPRSARPP